MSELELLELVELCYASVASPMAWAAFLAACTAAVRASVSSVATVEMKPRGLNWWLVHGLDPLAADELAARSLQDPRAALFPGLRPGQGYLFDESGYDIASFKRSPYFTECQSKFDVLWAVFARLDEAKGIDGLWSLHRPERADPFTAMDLRKVEVLARHIGRARRLQVDLELAEGRATLRADLLDWLPIGLVLLTSGGHVIEANRAARGLSLSRDGIAVQRDVLAVGDSAAAHSLAAMVNSAAKGALDGVGGVIAVPRPSGALDYVVSVVRCVSELAKVVGPRAAVLVAIADPAREALASADSLRALWQLTPTEAQFALALAAGHNIETVAIDRGVTLGTARVHLKRILAKTGTHRQSELVRLILAGPGALPVPPAVK